MEIKVLGPGCAKCQQLEKTVREVVEELGVDVQVEDIKEYQEDYGISHLNHARPGNRREAGLFRTSAHQGRGNHIYHHGFIQRIVKGRIHDSRRQASRECLFNMRV